MTIFEISAERESPLEKKFAGRNVIPLHFSNRNNFFRTVHWIHRTFGLRHMNFLEAGLLQLCRANVHFLPGSLRCTSSTKRCFPRHMTTQEFGSGVVVVWNLNCNSMNAKKLKNMNLKNSSNYCSSWICFINSGI